MKKKMTRSEAGKLGAKISAPRAAREKAKRREKYATIPALCTNCNKPLSYEQKRYFFCGHSCAAIYSNPLKSGLSRQINVIKCEHCKIDTHNPKYCSTKCSSLAQIAETNERINNGVHVCIRNLRRFVTEKQGGRCQICNITEWMSSPAPLVMDHINGNPEDNSLTNLRMICPNCDAQTPTRIKERIKVTVGTLDVKDIEKVKAISVYNRYNDTLNIRFYRII